MIEGVSWLDVILLSTIPNLDCIHSSVVLILASRSLFVTTLVGIQEPTPLIVTPLYFIYKKVLSKA